MRNTMRLIFSLCGVTLIYSCKKNDDNKNKATPAKEKTELILGTWIYQSITADKPYLWPDGVRRTDGMAYLGECAKSNSLTFEKGTSANTGTVIVYDNCDKTNSNEVWILMNDVLTLDDDYVLQQLDESRLVFTDKEITGANDTTLLTYTFTRK